MFSPKKPKPITPFRINYGFVHSYVPMDSDPLVQFYVTFSNQDDVDLSEVDVTAHICLVLDISGSMNKTDKLFTSINSITK